MKLLLAHVVYLAGLDKWYQDIANAAGDGIEVRCFCITQNPPANALTWPQLDRLWKSRNRQLMKMYERLQEVAADCDVMINYNGCNIHPEFLQYLPTFNIFCCFDDPENSINLSAPAAASYDAAFYGNIASRFQYESWGCKKICWLPIFTAPSDIPTQIDGAQLLENQRDIDIVYIGENTRFKQRRLEMLSQAFPNAICYGKGWEKGTIDINTQHQLYRRAKIGWNIHNTTGPINRRLFALAAFGVLQICDNKTGLGQIYNLGDEAVGFDTVPEAIELTYYYLENDNERHRIIQNAYQRFWKEYNATAIWHRIYLQLKAWGIEEHTTNRRMTNRIPRKSVRDILRPELDTANRYAKRVYNLTRPLLIEKIWREKAIQQTIDERVYLGEKVIAYQENPEMKGVNKAQDRLVSGDPLDWPNILALNWAITSLIGRAKRIVEIGSGTGPFAEYASIESDRIIDCFEEDDYARNKAIEIRSHRKVNYFKTYEGNLASNYDLLVSVEVIEHISYLKGFLEFCSKLAGRAIYTTPNRNVMRGSKNFGPPPYKPHVREYSPGELYWILKLYYKNVYLYYMPNVYIPWLVPMTITTPGTPIIAECDHPL